MGDPIPLAGRDACAPAPQPVPGDPQVVAAGPPPLAGRPWAPPPSGPNPTPDLFGHFLTLRVTIAPVAPVTPQACPTTGH